MLAGRYRPVWWYQPVCCYVITLTHNSCLVVPYPILICAVRSGRQLPPDRYRPFLVHIYILRYPRSSVRQLFRPRFSSFPPILWQLILDILLSNNVFQIVTARSSSYETKKAAVEVSLLHWEADTILPSAFQGESYFVETQGTGTD